MARTLKEAALTTRNAREKLPEGLHWRGIDREVHLGYRKGKRGGVWLVRWRVGDKYRQAPIGTADDVLKTDTLDYEAATKVARGIVERERRGDAARAAGPVLTVGSVVEAYIRGRNARDSRRAGRNINSDAHRRLHRYVLGVRLSGSARPSKPHRWQPWRCIGWWSWTLPNGVRACLRARRPRPGNGWSTT